ncbi:MAG: DNA glycosylase [Candidatus Nealsonbacteria bacterium]
MPSKKEIGLFRRYLLLWFKKNKRDYPWRETHDPFRILIAEMMLQRTKADQVLSVYNNFFSKFNSPEEVIHTDLKELRKILYPIGLKWRVKNFKAVCNSLIKNFDGKIPDIRSRLLILPGVGEYVAGITLSLAFNKPEWIIDSNIVRIFKRYFGISTTKEGRRDKHVIELAKMYIAVREPRRANLALLDFAALICVPKNPKCTLCPLFNTCRYYSLIRNKKS